MAVIGNTKGHRKMVKVSTANDEYFGPWPRLAREKHGGGYRSHDWVVDCHCDLWNRYKRAEERWVELRNEIVELSYSLPETPKKRGK